MIHLPLTLTALHSSLAFVEREMLKPCNHEYGTAKKLRRQIILALAEMDTEE